MNDPVKLELVEIDLSKTPSQGGAGLEVGPVYLCLIDGKFFTGRFEKQWYGLNFTGWDNPAGLQYDPPGTNYSGWQRAWRIKGAEELAAALEPEYAEARRAYAEKYLETTKPLKVVSEELI